MFKRYKVAIICLALVAGLAGAYLFGTHVEGLEWESKLETQRVEMQAKIDTERERREEISRRFETKLDNLKIVNTTINRTVEKELQKEIYTDCKLPDTGVKLINDNADRLNALRNGSPTK